MQQEQRTRHPANPPVERIVLFGTFTLNLQTGELRKNGVKIRLQNKPFQILKALLEQPGRVVNREDLRAHLWPEDTFVDFESGLNTAANRLRQALGDSAENPRYIETLPRIGYRFIAPVRHSLEPLLVMEPVERAVPILLNPAAVVSPANAGVATRGRRMLVSATVWRNPVAASALAATLFALGIGAASLWSHWFGRPSTPVFRQLTFRVGAVDNARFTASGEVVYSAEFSGRKSAVYLMDTASPESRELGFGPAWLAAVSRSSDLGLMHKPAEGSPVEFSVSELHGGTPRVVDKRVAGADWGPDGTLCLVRQHGGEWSLEYPRGKTLHTAAGWSGPPRVSPQGDLIAVAEHPLMHDDAGSISVIDRQGHIRKLSEGWDSIAGLAWNPNGAEVWFAAAKQGINRDVYAVDLKGRLRHVASMSAMLELFDISPSGRVLVGKSVSHMSMFVGDLASLAVKDASWLDWSHVVALSGDGNSILFDESGEGGGPLYTVYLYHRDSGTTERIGHGRAMDISPDGKWILTGNHRDSSQMKLISAANAEEKILSAPGLIYQSARFIPHSRDILVQANERDQPMRAYLQNLDSGAMRRIAKADRMSFLVPSPNGEQAAGFVSSNRIALINLSTGEQTMIDTTEPSLPVAWPSESELLIQSEKGTGTVLQKLNPHSGKKTPFREIPPQPGVLASEPCELMVSNNLKVFAYSRAQMATGLFAVDGWS